MTQYHQSRRGRGSPHLDSHPPRETRPPPAAHGALLTGRRRMQKGLQRSTRHSWGVGQGRFWNWCAELHGEGTVEPQGHRDTQQARATLSSQVSCGPSRRPSQVQLLCSCPRRSWADRCGVRRLLLSRKGAAAPSSFTALHMGQEHAKNRANGGPLPRECHGAEPLAGALCPLSEGRPRFCATSADNLFWTFTVFSAG